MSTLWLSRIGGAPTAPYPSLLTDARCSVRVVEVNCLEATRFTTARLLPADAGNPAVIWLIPPTKSGNTLRKPGCSCDIGSGRLKV